MQAFEFPDPEVRGTGTYAAPPRDVALATVRRELEQAQAPQRREELRAVLAALEEKQTWH